MYLASPKKLVLMYYFVFCFFYLLSLFPFWLLYFLSDGLYFLLYYVVGYRKTVVFSNLKLSFPEKTEDERIEIAKRFYRGLTDQILETIKMMSISKAKIQKRFSCDAKTLDYLEKQNLNCQVQLCHFFNWEWANLFVSSMVHHPLLVIYKPVSNKIMNRMFKYMRGRFGSTMISSDNLLAEMKPYKDQKYTSVLVADQHPPHARRSYWFPFLNIMTSFYKGPELSAKRNDLAIVFGSFKKVKRGHYKIETKLAFEHAKETEKGEITEAYVHFLDEAIRRQPENWLWSHKRWKRTWEGETNK